MMICGQEYMLMLNRARNMFVNNIMILETILTVVISIVTLLITKLIIKKSNCESKCCDIEFESEN